MDKSKPYRCYIYPFTSRDGGMTNPYIVSFIHALQDKVDIMNKNKPSTTGLFDIIKYLRRMDILFLNWPEEILEKKGGIIQVVFFFLLIGYLRMRKVKIVWTFHNKESHIKNKLEFKNCLRDFSARNADFIITHATDGIPILEKIKKSGNAKIGFFHHPVQPPVKLTGSEPKKYDLLLWGTVFSYKGIDRFLEYIKNEDIKKLKILIAGRIEGDSYRNIIYSYRSDWVTIIDAFITHEQLETFIAQSRFVLFTYLDFSILSSGALMDTLRYAPDIIGPHFGAFKDLQKEGLIMTYNDFPHLMALLDNPGSLPDKEKIYRFIEKNSWENFGNSVYNFILSE